MLLKVKLTSSPEIFATFSCNLKHGNLLCDRLHEGCYRDIKIAVFFLFPTNCGMMFAIRRLALITRFQREKVS